MKKQDVPIRVLIAEDSPVARDLLVAILQDAAELQVVGTARNGLEAVRLAKRLQPDVIMMDVYMPEMGGLEATRQIMSETPRPIVMVSANLNQSERNLTFDSLQAGALSVLAKPTVNDPPEVYQALITQLKLMSEVKVIRRWMGDKSTQRPSTTVEPTVIERPDRSKIRLVAIAASTGGPGILAEILRALPGNFSAPILIVQHITAGFATGLADWLNQQTPLEVRLARQGDRPQAGLVLIAPDNYHMLVNRVGLITLTQTPPVQNLRPAADVLFQSVAEVYKDTAIGVILTGMGSDGAAGLRAMRAAGAYTIAQDQRSCIVFGMPAVAIELGAATQVLPANKIAAAMTTLL
ncbi:MAG: chemotaxis-specific protein-glutamate methyltransferase CheB [Anaerolineae bacterium]